MAIRESDRGARLAAGEASPAARFAVSSFAGEDGLGALKAAVRAVTVDLADEAASVDAGDLVPKQAAAVLRVLGADARGAVDDNAMADIIGDLKRLTAAPNTLSMERRAAILRLQTTIRGLRRGLAAQGAPIGAGGRAAVDGMLTAADRLTIAWRDINMPPPERGATEPRTPVGGVVTAGSSPAIAERLRRDSLSPEEAEVITAADGRLTDATKPGDLAVIEAGRGRMLRTLDAASAAWIVDPLTAMRRIAADPAHANLADAAAWAIGAGPTGRRLKDSLEGLAAEVSAIDQAEARVAVRALDRSLTRFWQGNGIVAASWDQQVRELVGETLDDQLADALIGLAEGSPLARAQAERLSIFGLDGDMGRAAADQIRRFPPRADGRRLRTPDWTDRRAARAVDRTRMTETASALSGGAAARVWRVKALVDLLTALGDRLVNHFGERVRAASKAPATTLLDVLAPEIAKGAASALLDAVKGEDDPGPPSDPDRALAQGLVRSGLMGWLFETPPPTAPEQPRPGLDSPIGRMLQNLALLAVALGDGPPTDSETPPSDWPEDDSADAAPADDGSDPMTEWEEQPLAEAIDPPEQD